MEPHGLASGAPCLGSCPCTVARWSLKGMDVKCLGIVVAEKARNTKHGNRKQVDETIENP